MKSQINRIILLFNIIFSITSCTSFNIISPTKTPTIQPTPTDVPIFYENSISRDIFDEYPNSDCTDTESGWICTRKTSDWGMWYFNYSKTRMVEVYHSYYIDFTSISKDVASRVLAETESSIQNQLYFDAVFDWVSNLGLEEAAYNKDEIIKYEIEGIHVLLFFDSSDTIMFHTICYGFGCNELIVSQYQHEIENLPE